MQNSDGVLLKEEVAPYTYIEIFIDGSLIVRKTGFPPGQISMGSEQFEAVIAAYRRVYSSEG